MSKKKMTKTVIPQANYVMTPNIYFDLYSEMDYPEQSVMGVAIRQIIGWSSQNGTGPQPMSVNWFVNRANLTKNSVKKGIKAAIARGWLVKVDNKGENNCSRYTLNFYYKGWEDDIPKNIANNGEDSSEVEEDTNQSDDDNGGQNMTGGSKSDPPEGQNMTLSTGEVGGQNLTPYKNNNTIYKKSSITEGGESTFDDTPYSQVEDDLYDNPHEDLKGEPTHIIGHILKVFPNISMAKTSKAKKTAMQAISARGESHPSIEELARESTIFRDFLKVRLEQFRHFWEQQPQKKSENPFATIVYNLQKFEEPGGENKFEGYLSFRQRNRTMYLESAKSQKTRVIGVEGSTPTLKPKF